MEKVDRSKIVTITTRATRFSPGEEVAKRDTKYAGVLKLVVSSNSEINIHRITYFV